MKQSAYEKARDQRIADEGVPAVDRTLMCPAAGCPNRWSVSGDHGRGCSAHYWADPRDWPRITERLIQAESDRALYGAAARPELEPPTPEARRVVAAALAEFIAGRAGNRQGWAEELHRRHMAGEHLTAAAIDAYRAVLH